MPYGIPYCGPAPTPGELLSQWNFDPTFFLIVATAAAFLASVRAPLRPALACAAFTALVAAFASPLCALSSALFSARTAHHLVLMAVAAPLLAWAGPRLRLAPSTVAGATLVQGLVLWFWHAPPLYAAALFNDAVYWAMQLSLFGSALVFWMGVRASSVPMAIAALLITATQMGLLGALLTFAPSPLYAPHALTTEPWGLSALSDQRLGGLIMWAPASGVFLLAALTLLYRTLEPAPEPT